MSREPTGHIQRLPSGSYRVSVYAGTDPLTRRPIRLRATAKTETQARIELGKLLEKARDGRSPEVGMTMALINGFLGQTGLTLESKPAQGGQGHRLLSAGCLRVRPGPSRRG
jgi:hypothetical protein